MKKNSISLISVLIALLILAFIFFKIALLFNQSQIKETKYNNQPLTVFTEIPSKKSVPIEYTSKITVKETGQRLASVEELYANIESYLGKEIEIQTIFNPDASSVKVAREVFTHNILCDFGTCTDGACCSSCYQGGPAFFVDRARKMLKVVGPDYTETNSAKLYYHGTIDAKAINYSGNICNIVGYPFEDNTEYRMTLTPKKHTPSETSHSDLDDPYYLVLTSYQKITNVFFEEQYEKNNSCEKKRPSIEKDLRLSNETKNTVTDIFFSNVTDSCLYVEEVAFINSLSSKNNFYQKSLHEASSSGRRLQTIATCTADSKDFNSRSCIEFLDLVQNYRGPQ